jgi:hypothetical protein
MKPWAIITIVIIIIGLIALVLVFDMGRQPVPGPTSTSTATTTEDIIVFSPTENQEVHSPIQITGKAKGNWYFEASFPIQLVDLNGKVIATAIGQAQTDWMTTDYVDFKAEISYSATSTGRALLILKNDNPSGDPARDKSKIIPIILK